MRASVQPYQDFNARLKDYANSTENVHYLVCGWHTGLGGLLREDFWANLHIRSELYVADGFHPNLAGATLWPART